MKPSLWLIGAALVQTIAVAAEPTANVLTDREVQAGWKLLFDGKTTTAWRGYALTGFPERGWSVQEGCIKNSKTNGRPGGGGGDLVSVEQFENFDFRFEWRIAAGGNSGIKYFVVDRRATGG